VLGGAITEALGWRWVFLVNVAPCAAALLLVRAVLPESRGPGGRLDVRGALACTAGLAALILGLTRRDATAVAPLAAGALLLAAFAGIERRAPAPLLPPGTLRDRRVSGALTASLVITTASTGPLFLCVLLLQDRFGAAPTTAGLLFAPINLAVIAGTLAATRLHDARGAAATTGAGLALLAAGVAALLTLPAGGDVPARLPLAFVAIGAGIGAAALGSTAMGTAAVGADRQGMASGLLNTAAQLGNALGPAVCVLLATAGVEAAFTASAALALAAALGCTTVR